MFELESSPLVRVCRHYKKGGGYYIHRVDVGNPHFLGFYGYQYRSIGYDYGVGLRSFYCHAAGDYLD